MKKLNKNHRLFTELTTHPPAWWQNLISSPGVYVEVRKNCEQKWIDNEAEDINSRINKVACGAYYFGGTKYNCDLILKTKGNRYIFPY